MKTVAALVHPPHTAHQILEALTVAGLDPQQVGMTARSTSASKLAQDTVDELPISTVGGAGLDALLGAAASALVGAGEQVLPGIGAMVVTGPVAAALGVANTSVWTEPNDGSCHLPRHPPDRPGDAGTTDQAEQNNTCIA
jgi:hypothetical protein